ncbi:MAG: hypothetical protein MJY42_01565 [Bacteroidales bacterium]|nr:hypothetical protein [Bacteroidales bacterium]
MKKYIWIMALLAAPALAGAQSMYDAMTFSESLYYGTARSIALGNAVTALGGDLGSVTINPAGTAVANYSQVTLTPGLSISTTGTGYSPVYGGNSTTYNKVTKTKFVVPNGGMSLCFDTGRDYGIKTMTFSLVANTTNRHLAYAEGAGINDLTSISGYFARVANGMYGGPMMDPDIFDKMSDPWMNSDFDWSTLAAKSSNVIAYSKGKGRYLGLAENDDEMVCGPLRQTSITQKAGSKTDIVINMAFNANDNLYFGFNLGLPVQSYSYNESFREVPLDSEQFPITFIDDDDKETTTYVNGMDYNYSYATNMNGIYFKAGLIWLPVKNLRIGAAVKTPTAFTVSESWQTSASSHYVNSIYSARTVSPLGEYNYKFRSPYEINAGVAYTFGKLALLSVDYELEDFSVMRFNERGASNGVFGVVNNINRQFCGLAHNLRVGAELRFGLCFTARAGFNLKTSPERCYRDNFGTMVYADDYAMDYESFEYGRRTLDKASMLYLKKNVMSYSFGIGYASKGSFFADAAFRNTVYPVENFAPYGEYYLDVEAPNVSKQRNLIDIALTVGWRF